MKRSIIAVALMACSVTSMAFEASLDAIEIYKGDKNGNGVNGCINYLITEVYSIDLESLQGVKMKITNGDNAEEYDVNYWRPETKQFTFNYCITDIHEKDVTVVFTAPDGKQSNEVTVKANIDIAKALPPEKRPLSSPIK